MILHGDALTMLKTLPDESVHCCVTSPPYWGLRDYGVDGQLGLEKTPEEYTEKMTAVFREVRRVLRPDGTLWLNLGDSYAAARGGTHQPAETLAGGRHGKTVNGERVNRGREDGYSPTRNAGAIGLKHKDLIGIPWRVAFALQADGWYLRQDIIWHKSNPMPESVTDRCTKAHEYIFLMSKSQRYYYDAEAVKEPFADERRRKAAREGLQVQNCAGMGNPKGGGQYSVGSGRNDNGALKTGKWNEDGKATGRNCRSVWTVATHPYKEAHFATFPPDLIEPCILAGCPEGGTVLDPFFGSGTTGLVCSRLNREYIGIELNEQYCKMAERRIEGDAPLLNVGAPI
jgi:DNA modification methylase